MAARKTIAAVAAFLLFAAVANAALIEIGGEGAISTSDSPYGELGLLDGGEVATATFGFVVNPVLGGMELVLTVTNTSPAVLGTDAPIVPDAPVISDIFFSIPSQIVGITLETAGGVAAGASGWDFAYDPDATPSSGFGFLKSVFDVGMEGGPDPVGLDPVIASINDPDIYDGPGDPLPSPVDFVFSLMFAGGVVPTGFSADWFCDNAILGYPDYIAAAKFMSGANGGSGTVTNVVPEPATVLLLLTGVSALGAVRYRYTVKKST